MEKIKFVAEDGSVDEFFCRRADQGKWNRLSVGC